VGTYSVRLKATTSAFKSAEVSVTVRAPETTPNAVIDYVNETLTGLTPNAGYTVNGDAKTADSSGEIAIESGWFGTTVSLIKTGNTTTTSNSTVQSFPVPSRPAAPSVTGGANKITGADGTMEYSTDRTSWISYREPVPAGAYYVRVKQTVSNFAGTPTTGTVSITVGLPNMISVPAGTFLLAEGGINMSVSAFSMSETLITREQYFAIMEADPSATAESTGLTDPVQMLSWYKAVEFCNKLSAAQGKTEAYTISGQTVGLVSGSPNGYRLATEMEWMWAAMGANTTSADMSNGVNVKGYKKEFAGDPNPDTDGDSPNNYAWYKSNAGGKTHPVKTKLPNELGLYDMSGNVAEWCWDWNGTYPASSQTDYTGPFSVPDSNRARRGGSWDDGAARIRMADRDKYGDTYYSVTLGFRVVCRP
jgi:formylglycine-generating enzyme required for sulfatase activity